MTGNDDSLMSDYLARRLEELKLPIPPFKWDRKRNRRRLRNRWTLTAGVAAVLALVAVIAMTATYSAGSTLASEASPISQEAAVADALRQLPNNGAGYRVVKVELEPSSKHFDFQAPNGDDMGQDGVTECLVIPPLPRLPLITFCRYYPVWVVALSSPSCEVIIGINAYTGRFAGGGTATSSFSSSSGDQCALTPEAPDVNWFQPMWG